MGPGGGKDLGDLFIEWTSMTETLISVVIFGLGALGLAFSLMSFMNLYGAVRDSAEQGMMSSQQSPLWHMIAIIVAGLVSVSGLIWGFSSLVFSSAV